MPSWANNILAIGLLLLVIVVVVRRLPKVEIEHTPALLGRRRLNWLVVGLTYAFLYMGRYNLTVASKAGVLPTADFSKVFAVGTVVYGVSFLLNGPLTDRFGGRATIIVSAFGSAAANVGIGVVLGMGLSPGSLLTALTLLYATNMYFQSFGAASIVKVNAAWFHVRERGTFGGIFGILISLGVYFAFDWNSALVKVLPPAWIFFVPAIILVAFGVADTLIVRDSPAGAGLEDFDTGDASSGDNGPRLSSIEVGKRMLRNPIILTITFIEFCSGYLRNALMQYYPIFAARTGAGTTFVTQNWGLMLCVAGILGGVFAGTISDHLFQSRRGPVSAVLYGFMFVGSLLMVPLLGSSMLGWLVVFMSMSIIGVHGMLSGTASADFGGKKNAGVAVGIIDGFVYLGTGLQAVLLGKVLPQDKVSEKILANWSNWPLVLILPALIGFVLALRIWKAKPQGRAASH
ncbi:MAG: MFS transporter [Myxococcales bacterium]|nr:MFS transporter [Myxococcales bacterium]